MNKLKELLNLRKKIITEFFINNWKEVWFFKGWNNVKGYKGVDNRIMFIALNPSYGKTFPDDALKHFYNALKKEGYANCHITDLIKLRLSGKERTEFLKEQKNKDEQIKFLKREINIIRPKLKVSIGRKVEKILKEYKIDSKYIHHYAYAFRYNKKTILLKDLKDLKKKL